MRSDSFLDIQPPWFHAVMFIVEWSPAIVLALLTARRLARGWRVRPIAFGAGIAAAYLLAVGVLLGRPVIEDHWHRQAFDAARWRRNERSNDMWPVRLTMVDDLLARQMLRGLQRDSVVRLLGPGDSTVYSAAQNLVYVLGPERGLIAIDYELLVVEFAPDGRVIAQRVMRD